MSSSSSSSSWSVTYIPDGASHTVSAAKPLHLLYPNQFYKICPESFFSASDNDGSDGGDGNGSSTSNSNDPVCGDGSSFCFYFSKPSQKYANNNKLLIELMGGGACWDARSCEKQQERLYINGDLLDDALGRSCQEVQYGMQQNDQKTNMLCSVQFGDKVNFRRYNTIIVPYCTQDVHLGSNTIVYDNNNNNNNNNDGNNDDDGNSRTVHHAGARNLRFVVDWIVSNFPGLRHAAVTGCSAGGTAVPVVQALLHRHYNHFGNRGTQVAAISDSPVYLTPSYFLEHGLGNWDPQSILSSIGVPYAKYKTSEEYPTTMWDYILRKGNNKNRWGFVSHTEDPVSLTYYQYMSGYNNHNYYYYYGDDNNDDNSNSNNNIDDYESQWYSELTKSVKYIERRHSNVKSFWMESEGHCSFGLYYALQEETFGDFASSVFREDPLSLSPTPAVRSFCLAAISGSCLVAYLVFQRIRRQSTLQPPSDNGDGNTKDDDSDEYSVLHGEAIWSRMENFVLGQPVQDSSNSCNNNNNSSCDGETYESDKSNAIAKANAAKKYRLLLLLMRLKPLKKRFLSLLVAMEDYPVTAGYSLCITVYLTAMLANEGFAHPINNPSLGPSALGLSVFGINNPSLIVYQHQWFRLFASNFLVSGLLTFGLAIFYLYFRIGRLEQRMIHDFKSPWLFVTVIILLATILNAVYCLVPPRRGASTAAIPLLIGLQTFHLTFYWNSFVRPYLSIGAVLFDSLVVVTFFPFNSWVMIVAAFVAGWIMAKMARTFDIWLPGPMVNVLKQSGFNLQTMNMNMNMNINVELGNGCCTNPTTANTNAAHATSTIATPLSSPKTTGDAGNHQTSFGKTVQNQWQTSAAATSLVFPLEVTEAAAAATAAIAAAASESEHSTFDRNTSCFRSSSNNSNDNDNSNDNNNNTNYETMHEQRSTCPAHNRSRRWKFVQRAVCCGLLALFVLLLVPLFVTLVAKPNELYQQPFYTGCRSFYTVDIDELAASSFLTGDDDDGNNNDGNGNANNDRNLVVATTITAAAAETSRSFVRWLAGGGGGNNNENDGGYECAEFCIPHLVVPVFQTVLRKKKVPISRGRCTDQGYSTHVIDKTFSAFSYSLDVELYSYSSSGSDDDDGKNKNKNNNEE